MSTPVRSAPALMRETEIRNWRPHIQGTLRGFFSVRLSSGIVIHRMSLFQKADGQRSIGMPNREYQVGGERRYEKVVELDPPELMPRFVDEVLAALDRHFATGVQG